MTISDKDTFRPGDILTAVALLTRLPVRAEFSRGAQAAWAYPLAGLALAIPAALMTGLLMWLGVPPSVAALFWVAAMVVMSGAMHEDGLADCADGFWGGFDRVRRLEIMKDSRIGAYGVIALNLSLVARWACVAVILGGAGWGWSLVAAAALSRAAMPALMYLLPHARPDGLSQSQGRPVRETAIAATAVGFAITLVCTGLMAIWLAVLVGASTLAVMQISRAKIGGQTGDVLGAAQQCAEIVLLVALAAAV